MDLKDDEKSVKFQDHSHITSRYFESNAGHLFINNVNPFNSVGGYGGDAIENQRNKRKNDDFVNLFDNTTTNDPNNTASKAFVNEIMNNYPLYDRNNFANEPYDELQEAFIGGTHVPNRLYSQPTVNMSTNVFDTQYMTSCSKGAKTTRYENQVRFDGYNEDDNRYSILSSNEMMTAPTADKNGRAEKTTYCRPLLNMYNQEFVYKTMQRNEKLQRLVRKLVIAREREKQREAWNNYINDLKNKHMYYSNEPSRISPQYVPDDHNNPELIDDFYNTKWRQSNPCQHLLQDFYEAHNPSPANMYDRHPGNHENRPKLDIGSYPYQNNRFCYPTSSQANILRLNRERQGNNYGNDWRNRPSGRYFRGNTIIVDKERKGTFDKIQGTSRSNLRRNQVKEPCNCKTKICSLIPNISIPVQTDITCNCDMPLDNNDDDKNENVPYKSETFKEKFKRVTSNIAKLKNKIRKSEEEETRVASLANIENKIDALIKSLNSIMVDIKSTKGSYGDEKSASVSARFVTTSHNNLYRPKSETYGLIKNEEYVCGMVQHSSRSLTISEVGHSKLTSQRESSISKMDKIILEEMKKSNKVKRDIEELLNLRSDRNCSVQITFDIPTKERSTEVTDSLSKARLGSGTDVIVEEFPVEGSVDGRHTQMTIAVNTDPLGLLALFRVSTETVKQLLSYVPNLNYNSYLSMLQLPSKRCVSHYICNICGAAFGRPSQLSDHIEQHNLGRTRDCCVCRHTLDMQKSRIGLFACRYCGQRFTRAYCCELHQQTCARRLGRIHDISSSHVLLR